MHNLTKTALAFVTLTLVGTARADDYPRYRGANFNGIATEKNWLGAWPDGSPKRLWKKNVGTGFSSLAVAAGKLFTLGNAAKQDTVFALDANTGAELWKHSYAEELDPKYYEGGPSATPTVAGDRVFTMSKQGHVFCLEAATGKVVWELNVHDKFGAESPDWGFAGSPHVDGDLVILNVGSHGLALNKDTGEKVWFSGKEASGYGTPVPFKNEGKPALAIFAAKAVVAIEPKTGAVLWQHPWETSYDVNSADPVVSGNLMFLSSGYDKGGSVVSFAGNQPKKVWFNKEIRSHFQTSVILGGNIYGVDGQGGDKDSKLKCLDLGTGKVLWTSPAAETGTVSATADGRLLWLTGKGELVVVEAKPDGYKEIARAQVTGGKCWTAPVLANGKVYVRNAKGDVVCVDVRGTGPMS